MIFVLKPGVAQPKIDDFAQRLEERGFATFLSTGTEHTVVCLIGNTASIDMDAVVETNDIVEYGRRITEPYKAVNRNVHPADTMVKVGGVVFGQGMARGIPAFDEAVR